MKIRPYRIIIQDKYHLGGIRVTATDLLGKEIGSIYYSAMTNRIEDFTVRECGSENVIRKEIYQTLVSCLQQHGIDTVDAILMTQIYSPDTGSIREMKNTLFLIQQGFKENKKLFEVNGLAVFTCSIPKKEKTLC